MERELTVTRYAVVLALAVAAQYLFTVSPQTGAPLVEASDTVATFFSSLLPLQWPSGPLFEGAADADATPIPADAPAPQPDQVRRSSQAPRESDRELRCGEKIPPESLVATRDVEIFVKSNFEGRSGGEQHQWSYKVEFRNTGVDTVQMLTRHWL